MGLGATLTLKPDKESWIPQPKTISRYLKKLPKPGGYLARKNDPPPGNTVVWRGPTRLADILVCHYGKPNFFPGYSAWL